jgi:hypothetical protein
MKAAAIRNKPKNQASAELITTTQGQVAYTRSAKPSE